MVRDRTYVDLKSTLSFRKSYVESIIKVLEAYFYNNDIISLSKDLISVNMPSKRLGLASLGVTDLKFVLKHYGVQKEGVSKILLPFVKSNASKRKFVYLFI